MLRDRLIARLNEMGAEPDYVRLAHEVLGIRNAPPALAKRLVSQALVVEDRRDVWVRTGERICAAAPQTAGVYVLRDAEGLVLYVGKAINLRRRLRTHFAPRRWHGLKVALARAAQAEWHEVGSDLEALLREAVLIRDLQEVVNVQVGPPGIERRAIPVALARGGDTTDVAAHRLFRFFRAPLGEREDPSPLAPIVFSWLAGRGVAATRLDPYDSETASALTTRVGTFLRDSMLFTERLEVR